MPEDLLGLVCRKQHLPSTHLPSNLPSNIRRQSSYGARAIALRDRVLEILCMACKLQRVLACDAMHERCIARHQ